MTTGPKAQLLSRIAKSGDREWLKVCSIHNEGLGFGEVVEAVKQRLRDLDLQDAMCTRPTAGSLEARVMEALRIYEAVPLHKHGQRRLAGYTRKSLKNHGARESLIKIIRRGKETAGLQRLKQYDRVDCAYEQIALDFADGLPPDVVKKARIALGSLASRPP